MTEQRHHITLTRGTFGFRLHSASCSCGWVSLPEHSEAAAVQQGDEHVLAVTR